MFEPDSDGREVERRSSLPIDLSPCRSVSLSPRPSVSTPRGHRVLTTEQYYAGVRAGDRSVLARALTLIESSSPRHQQVAEELLTRLLPHTGGAIRVGITGVPGVGKSTFIDVLGLHLVERGLRVAVLAVDPSSAVSGGSILGDKTRMPGLAAHPHSFIRPSPSAGSLGGVARKTRECVLVCEAGGFDVILIETLGVGQAETAVADMTDCLVSLMLPGAGDELQGIKRGLIELVNVLIVNKADGPLLAAAELAAQQYRFAMQSLIRRDDDPPTVLTCSALKNTGIEAAWQIVEDRHTRLLANGDLNRRRQQQNLRWLWALVEDRLRELVSCHPAVQTIRSQLEQDVFAGKMPPAVAARQFLQAIQHPSHAPRAP